MMSIDTSALGMTDDMITEKTVIDDTDGVHDLLPDVVHTAMRGIAGGLGKIGDSVDELVDEITDSFNHVMKSFAFSIPFNQESVPAAVNDENLGNNIHLPSLLPNGAPYRFGLHIRRDDLGYRIARIFKNTIAHHAKLEENDILTHLNDVDLSATNIVKVISLFSRVGNPFSLTILRELESCERIEIVIQITIEINDIEQSIDFKVTVRGTHYIRDTNDTLTTYYITQDPDGESEQYVNMESNGSLVMGSDQNAASFVLEKYFTIFADDSFPVILKTSDGRRAFSFTQERMMPFNLRQIRNYMMNATVDNDGSSVFEQLCRQDGDSNRYFLNNSDGQIVVSAFEDRDSVSTTARFVLYSADEESTRTASTGSDEEGPRHSNGRPRPY
ncbi:uncharacterized protein LOC121429905 [Lytechinus variegatus]|uniref:uncharacterized protein LOC121429905 n=1 Tax=Lytechinus variegatus TaxID=7654 RepID=UPI001BB22533|nr:uncharacterized protein LOC121429905 [Lytechinus variegatus]